MVHHFGDVLVVGHQHSDQDAHIGISAKQNGFSPNDLDQLKRIISQRYCDSAMNYNDVASRLDWGYEKADVNSQDISKNDFAILPILPIRHPAETTGEENHKNGSKDTCTLVSEAKVRYFSEKVSTQLPSIFQDILKYCEHYIQQDRTYLRI